MKFANQKLVNRVSMITTDDGKNLLHLAAVKALEDSGEETQYFTRLMDLKFPLYNVDQKNNYPAFILTNIKNDSKFMTAYYALLEKGFDINYPNPSGLTFL
jgi:hypothetical protein